MASRRIGPGDYVRIAQAVISCIDTVKATVDKAIAKNVDATAVMSYIIGSDNAWLVDDTFLVMFHVGTPWYSPSNIIELREELVLRLKPGLDFSVVPAFLEQRAEAEGVCLTAVGTALASSDDALATKYEEQGFRREATLLIKER